MTRTAILVDAHVLDGKPQGTCGHIAGLYGELAQRDIARIYMATEYEESLDRWFPGVPGIEWVPLKSRSKFIRLGYELDQLAARIAPNFMHFQYIAPLIKRTKWIVTVHDLLFLDYPQYFPLGYRLQNHILFRLSALRADVLLTVSEYSRASLARNFNIECDRIHITHNGYGSFATAEQVPITGLKPRQFLVYVSRFEPRKNQDGLVRAFREMLDDLPADLRLVLVGNPALSYPALEIELGKAGNRVLHLSNLTTGELAWLYANAAASIYPSFAEGFGMPPIEAVAAGGMSYAAANTAMLEVAKYIHGTFNAEDIDDIKRVIELAYRCGGVDSSQSAEIRNDLMRTFSWEHSADQFCRALDI